MAALASLPKHRVYECARCHKKQPLERTVFSTHTRLRYCSDINACGRRAKRKGKH